MAEKSLSEFVDVQTGFGATSTKVTTGLATQTLAFKGNADAALAAAEAQAGLSTSASDALNASLKLATQIKAGAQAQQQATQLTRAAVGVGNAPTGLYSGYGGIAGSALLGESLGGGRGYTESLSQQFGAIFGKQSLGDQIPSGINAALSFATNSDYRNSLMQKNPAVYAGLLAGASTLGFGGTFAPQQQSQATKPPWLSLSDTQGKLLVSSIGSYNDALDRGSKALNETSGAHLSLALTAAEMKKAEQTAADAGDFAGVQMAQFGVVLRDSNQKIVTSTDLYTKTMNEAAVGQGIQSPAQMAQAALQQEILRQTQAAASVQAISLSRHTSVPRSSTSWRGRSSTRPSRSCRRRHTSPTLPRRRRRSGPVSPRRVPPSSRRSTRDQGRRRGFRRNSMLTTPRARIRSAIPTTPRSSPTFKQAGLDTFDGLLSQIGAVGQQMSDIQSSINWEQAKYGAAQYTNQLRIASRSLSDIAGLTNDAKFGEQSYVGQLERANLLLGRQAQQLQFGLSQRQINLQTALAGFQVPGLTPAEQNARVEEAKKETSYAQKQLDIQRKMFGNQVQIVDITNLRQGVDLLQSISAAARGSPHHARRGDQAGEPHRLQKIQSAMVNEVSTYISSVDSLSSKAISDIAAQEAAIGGFIGTTEEKAVKAAYHVGQALYLGMTGGFLGRIQRCHEAQRGTAGVRLAVRSLQLGRCSTCPGPTTMTVGEAGTETVAVLRNPRTVMSNMRHGWRRVLDRQLLRRHHGQVRGGYQRDRPQGHRSAGSHRRAEGPPESPN